MTAPAAAQVRFGEPAGRWVIFATVLGSGMAFLDATVVNVALPRIGDDLDADLGGLQWTLNGYTLTLASFILLGGSLADRLGRRRIFVFGTIWFALASALCGLAPNIEMLVAARLLQGVGGALLTPGSLAIISASFSPEDRSRAIGAWSGLAGIAGAAGPFLGGWLVDAWTWRLVFLINLPFSALVVWVSVRHVPESVDPTASSRLDLPGTLLGALGLAGLTYASISGGEHGADPLVVATGAVGVLALAAFVWVERTSDHPLVPPALFGSRQFTVANVVTFLVYGALGAVLFLLVLDLQVVAGFSPLAAGTSLLPFTLLMLAAVGPVRRAGRADRAAAADDRRPADRRRRRAAHVQDRPGRLVPDRCAAGRAALRARHDHAGRAADRDRALGRAERPGGHRVRGEQRRGPGRRAARGRAGAGGRRAHRDRLPGCGRVPERFPRGHLDRCRDARGRWTTVRRGHQQPAGRRDERGRAPLLVPDRRAADAGGPTWESAGNTMTSESSILNHIDELVAEERQLRSRHRGGEGLTDAERDRMRELEVQLDQAWDLLRQRRAKAEYGDEPDNATQRSPGEVETYLQ